MQLCCIFLLVFAQQTALTHAVWHSYTPAAAHAGEALATHPDQGGYDLVAVCAFDAAFGQVLGAAAERGHRCPHSAVKGETPQSSYRASASRDLLTPSCRGPPSLLET
jgi:hypothetical protein